MMRKILHFVDKRNFGNQVVVYTGKIRHNEIYFVVIQDREEIVYSFLDNNLERLYPVDTYIASLGYEFDINEVQDNLDVQFDIDLTRYGSSPCPAFLSELIKQNI